MGGATKVVLETIQVARHVGRLGLRPVQKVARGLAQVGEDFAIWGIKLHPVQEVLGRERSVELLDAYFQVKEVVAESVTSLSHQSWTSALQTGAQYATLGLRQAGVAARVIGPLDEHWHVLKVIKSLRVAEQERRERTGHSSVTLTPRRFVQFMREAERKMRRARQRDLVEDYVDAILQKGTMSSMGPRQLEKKLYTDVARIICFAFDRALFEANGMDVWGHALNVRVVKEEGQDSASGRPRARSAISLEQVEYLVERMLSSKDLQVPGFMQGFQRQLLVNCSVMILHLIEDLTSERHMQINVLGHALSVTMEPLSMEELWEKEMPEEAQTFRVSAASVDELVEALMAEPEVNLVFLPDALEVEVYRLALHRMICIGQFMLSQLRICLFGSEVRLEFMAPEMPEDKGDVAGDMAAREVPSVSQVHVLTKDLRIYMSRLDAERKSIERELKRRRQSTEEGVSLRTSLDPPVLYEESAQEEGGHEFEKMAVQDRLSRSLSIQRVVDVPIEVAYKMVSDIAEYPTWMPFCTGARVLTNEGGNRTCFFGEVGFGLATGTVLGTVGDNIRYRITITPPASGAGTTLRAARVVADTPAGFAYGKRLVYDWRFRETEDGGCEVRLDMFFQARSLWFLPLWDSMQATITGALLTKFQERAKQISGFNKSGNS
mmetsp:Transcript_99483/g.252718  ORF Transcript_99483/g.252718 Transcript_99483/m.252718 type:complete len:664 (-) Transcript_99483:37-2028(-)